MRQEGFKYWGDFYEYYFGLIMSFMFFNAAGESGDAKTASEKGGCIFYAGA